jgi:hypothetical protein
VGLGVAQGSFMLLLSMEKGDTLSVGKRTWWGGRRDVRTQMQECLWKTWPNLRHQMEIQWWKEERQIKIPG